MIRKRNDSDGYRRGAVGIDDDKAGNFTKANRSDPWTVEPRSATEGARGDGVKRVDNVKPGRGVDDDIGVGVLRNKEPDGPGRTNTSRDSGGGDAHDLFDNVERNSNAGRDKTGPVKFGVD